MSKQPTKKEAEYGTKMRLLLIMRALLDWPYGYTKKELVKRYGASDSTISNDFEALRNSGFMLDYDEKYRYAFVTDNPYRELKDLLHFSEEDQLILMQAIDKVSEHTKRAERLKRKLASIYDYHRLGHAYLRKPYLSRLDQLIQAKNESKQVILVRYRSSNSNVVSDRTVEPFHLNPSEDILQAYDVDKHKCLTFRLSRVTRVKLTVTDWQFTNYHVVMPSDPFRIVDSNQVTVHLRLRVGAYNELIERFPLTQAHIVPAEDPDVFDFQCLVNHRFLGLTNFILGTHHQVEVLEPESLLEHLRAEVQQMKF